MKHQTINLVKFKALCKRLSIPLYQGIGLLESLWIFTQIQARDGNLSEFSELEIAGWIEWPGDERELIRALVETRWLDRTGDLLLVHGWNEHKPNWLKGVDARGAVGKFSPSTEPSTEPSNVPPNLTQPNLKPVPEPVAGVLKKAEKPESAFSELETRDLSNAETLEKWHNYAAKRPSPLFVASEASLLRVIGAAVHAQRMAGARNRIGVFAAIVQKGDGPGGWELITQDEEVEAQKRICEMRRSRNGIKRE